MNFLGKAFVLVTVGVLSGCTTMDWTDYRQPVPIRSNPAGAKIIVDSEVVGSTPKLIDLRRRRSPNVTLQFPNGSRRTLILSTKYRWKDSFSYNFFALTLAPVGWATDLMTGTAWDIQTPAVQQLSGETVGVEQDNLSAPIAIAPIDGVTIDESSVLGQAIETKLRSFGRNVVPYENTAPTFDLYGSQEELLQNEIKKNRIYKTLGVTDIFWSHAQPTPTGYVLSGRVQNVFATTPPKAVSWEVSAIDETAKERLQVRSQFSEYFHLLPNTAFLNASSYKPTATIDNLNYPGTYSEAPGIGSNILQYLSAISLSRVRRPIDQVKGRGTLDFVPSLFASHKRIQFNSYAPLNGLEFTRLYASVGYGLEVGHLSKYGFFYIDISPQLTWTQIKVRGSAEQKAFTDTSVTFFSEFGYQKFFTDHLIVKLYIRTLGEDYQLWQKAIRYASNADAQVTSANGSFAGIAIGYHLPSKLTAETTRVKIR